MHLPVTGNHDAKKAFESTISPLTLIGPSPIGLSPGEPAREAAMVRLGPDPSTTTRCRFDVRHSIKVSPDAVHLPERFGLFTLILLGESVVAVMQGTESQEDWTPEAATSAFLGMGISFLIWWWYFDGASAASEQPVRTKRDSVRFHIWSYAHFPFSVGIVIAGVGIQRIVTAASRAPLTTTEALILISAVTVVMLSMTAIGATSAGRHRKGLSGVSQNLLLTAATLGIGLAGHFESPVDLIITIAALCLAQLGVSLTRTRRSETLAHTPVFGE